MLMLKLSIYSRILITFAPKSKSGKDRKSEHSPVYQYHTILNNEAFIPSILMNNYIMLSYYTRRFAIDAVYPCLDSQTKRLLH